MRVENILKEKDVGSYNKLMNIKEKRKRNKSKNQNKNEKLSERDLEELMSHSSYKRHKGAMKQVK